MPEVVATARGLIEGTRLSFKAVAARTGVSTTTLCRWCRREGWVRPGDAEVRPRPPRYRRGRGTPYAADAVSQVRDLLTRTLLSQAEIARRVGICQAQVSVWLRRHGWTRPSVPPCSRRFAAAARVGLLAVDGDRRGRPYAPALRTEARALWEDTRLPTSIIGARLGVHAGTVARWAKTEAWVRPRGRIGVRQLRGYFGSRRPRPAGGAVPAGSGAPRIRRL